MGMVNKMEYKDLEKVNSTLKGIDVKGKKYIEVNERIRAFRQLYPQGSITTEMLSNENGICVFKATVMVDGCELATGHAYEKENSTFINKTSYIENCETSAVGRCLGILGIGIDMGILSAEEVQNTIENQKDLITTEHLSKLMNKVIETETDLEKLLEAYEVSHTNELTEKQYENAMKILEKKVNKENEVF